MSVTVDNMKGSSETNAIIKKGISAVLLAGALVGGTAAVAQAETVYYKGSALSFDHGRSWGVYSESTVQSGVYDHSTTANTTFSGWEKPGTAAHAIEFVGTGQATAYWNARG